MFPQTNQKCSPGSDVHSTSVIGYVFVTQMIASLQKMKSRDSTHHLVLLQKMTIFIWYYYHSNLAADGDRFVFFRYLLLYGRRFVSVMFASSRRYCTQKFPSI